MKFQRSAPRVLIFSIVVVIIGMAVLSNRLFSGLTSAVEQDQFELIRAPLELQPHGGSEPRLGTRRDHRGSAGGPRGFCRSGPRRSTGPVRRDVQAPEGALRRRSGPVLLPSGGLVLTAARARAAWRPPGPVPADGRRGQSRSVLAQRVGHCRNGARDLRGDARDRRHWPAHRQLRAGNEFRPSAPRLESGLSP